MLRKNLFRKQKTAIPALGIGMAMMASFFSPTARADDFTFTFTNTIGNTPGTVTGEIYGLVNNSTGAATDIIITSAPANVANNIPSFDINTYASDTGNGEGFGVTHNSFTELNGQITAAVYQMGPGFFDINLVCCGVSFPGGYNELITPNDGYNVVNLDGLAGITFSPASVPEPSSVILLSTILLSLAFVARKRFAQPTN